MLILFWVLFSLGVAYAAKIGGRSAGWWFILSVALTPLVGSVLLTLADRKGWYWKR